MLPVISNFLSRFSPAKPVETANAVVPIRAPLQALGINDFLNLDIPPREMLLAPILPERSLAMLYAPRGLGKSWLALSIGLATATGASLLLCSAPRPGNAFYFEGKIPLFSLKERLKEIPEIFGRDIPNDA